MIEHITDYIEAQIKIVHELEKRNIDLWSCYETEVYGWRCESHGEHICCIKSSTCAQIEIPLLSKKNRGVDTGHFIHYLKSIGINAPSYLEMHKKLERLESDDILNQVQTVDRPIIWSLRDENRITFISSAEYLF